MKIKKNYLKGKSVFYVSLVVITVTSLTVYLTGINYNRTVTSNLYLSLAIIGTTLFLFMTYGLYKGIGLKDNFPSFKPFKKGRYISDIGFSGDLPDLAVGDGIAGVLVSILLWIAITIAFALLLLLLEALIWLSLFIILAMLYWVFFRALKLVFSKVKTTKGDLTLALLYSISYTALYLGCIFGIVYVTQILR